MISTKSSLNLDKCRRSNVVRALNKDIKRILKRFESDDGKGVGFFTKETLEKILRLAWVKGAEFSIVLFFPYPQANK